ncbi:hypothetical protein ACI6PS_02640 [Flavobacterium sp. PLA-1-15]|uniref:hypothetical protein n=1 Tax=Flavobacterium sp. PLA-1-15 TaxID=3380533 RepID=UPI003B7B5709
MKIKDAIGAYPQCDTFRLTYLKQFEPSNVVAWLAPFSYDSSEPVTFGHLSIEENGLELIFPIELININLLPLGIYKFRQVLSLQGRSGGSLWQELSYINFDTFLHIVDDLVFYAPKNIIFTHTVGTVPPAHQIQMNGVSWSLVGTPRYLLFSTDPSVTIQNVSDETGNFQIASGTGEKTVSITLTNFFDQPSAPGTIPITLFINQLKVKSGSVIVDYVDVRVRKLFTQVLELSPDQLNFIAIKNVNDPAPQNIIFTCNVPGYVLTYSPWLTVTVEQTLIDGQPEQVLRVTTMSTFNLEAGIYIGHVTVTAVIGGIEKIETTIIRYQIDDLTSIPYEYGQFAFTLDKKSISLLSFNSATYIQMKTEVKTFDFFTGLEKNYSVPEKIGLFQGKAKINIGRRIHQLLNKNKKPDENIFQYKPAKVTMFFEERNLSDNTLIRSENSDEFLFVAGLSEGFSKFGFLKFNRMPERVTKNEFKYFNILVPAGEFNFLVYKNGVEYSNQMLLPSDGHIMTKKLFFEEFNQGDKIEVSLKNETGETDRLIFYVIPEGKYSNHIIWEDIFLLKSSIECHGNFTIKSDFTFVSANNYEDFVSQLEYLDITKVAKVTINTGWILKTQVDSIESLMRSKNVWIGLKEKKVSLRPLNQSLVNEDSERELIDYTLEFQINPETNEETYRF